MAGSDEHLKPLRLFDVSRQSAIQLTYEEQQHFRLCEGCQRIVEVFARQFKKPDSGPQDKPEDAE